MKRILALLFTLVMLLALTACGKDEEGTPTGESTGTTTIPQKAPTTPQTALRTAHRAQLRTPPRELRKAPLQPKVHSPQNLGLRKIKMATE